MTPANLDTAELGYVFVGMARHLTLARGLAFSGGPFDAPNWPERNLHTDLREANAAGLATVVASGTQFEGYLSTHLVRLCGNNWYSHGTWDVKIVRSVRIDDFVTPMARLLARQASDDGVKVDFEVWCENQNTEKVLVGNASCCMPKAVRTAATCG